MSKRTPVAIKPRLARVSEAAQALGISRGLMYKLINQPDSSVPVKRIGDAIRIPWAWVDQQSAIDEDDQQRL